MIYLLMYGLLLVGAGFTGAVFARRLSLRDGGADKDLQEVRERLLRLEQSIESMAGDVDRVSEGHRFLTALLEGRAKGQGALPRPDSPTER
jgi:hypothetical protein